MKPGFIAIAEDLKKKNQIQKNLRFCRKTMLDNKLPYPDFAKFVQNRITAELNFFSFFV